MPAQHPPRLVRFGVFEFDVETGDLWNAGQRVRLQEQPRQVLQMLLACPGEVVTRDALRAALWPDDTFVDFDAGLNVVVTRIRNVLRDSAASPRFIETLPRRGYRFIAPVSARGDVAPAPVVAPTVSPRRQQRHLLAAGVTGALATVAVGLLWSSRNAVEPAPLRVLPVAALAGYEIMPTLSPDGEQVAFGWNGDRETENFDIYLTIPGSPAARRLTTDAAIDVNPSWSPDGRQLAFVRYRPGDPEGRVYLMSPLGGAERRLSDFGVTVSDNPIVGPFGQLSWSPDGRYIAAARASFSGQRKGEGTGVYLIPTQGGEPRLLTDARAPSGHRDPAFSPDGRQLGYLACTSCCYAACDVETVDMDARLVPTGASRRLTSMATQMHGLAWTPDGRSLVFGAEPTAYVTYLWRVDSNGHRPPERLEVAGPVAQRPALVSTRSRLVFARSTQVPNIYRYTPGAAPQPTIVSSFPDFNASFSPDGSRIVFASARSGETAEIWTAAADGSGLQQLTRGMANLQASPRWAPDGRLIAFASRGLDGLWQIWTIDVDGGNLRQRSTGPGDRTYPSWSRDGLWVYFSKDGDGGRNIWRIALADGREEQVTREGGFAGFESADGKSLIYRPRWDLAGTPLLAVPLSGGAPRQLVKCVYGFSVSSNGIYYYACDAGGRTAFLTHLKPLNLRLIDPTTRQDRLLGRLDGVADRFWSPNASPDGTTILYARVASVGGDLMMIENFR